MEKKVRISASILAADFKNLDKEIKRSHQAKVDWLHFDVMDGVFVNNISFGIPVLKSISCYPIFKDVHLMIVHPEKYVDEFIKAGADLITFHLEAMKYKKDVKALINHIHDQGVCVGISIKPSTPVEDVLPYLKDIDLVLVMSVEPGFGGQKFMESSLAKISELDAYIIEHQLETMIEVDGGINDVTSTQVKNAGVDVIVAGSYLFKSENMKESVKLLKGKA